MSIKDLLLQEAQNISTSVELDGIFESVELSDDVKTKFSAVFEQVVKTKAVELAEEHIRAIAEHADSLVEDAAQERFESLSNVTNQYFEHLVDNWMNENKLAVENGIKVQMFDSMMSTLAEAFVTHNIEVPDDKVSVVSTLEEALQERNEANNQLLNELTEARRDIATMKREKMVTEAVAGLSDVQRSKVLALSEGLSFTDEVGFGNKMTAIVEMVSSQTTQKPEQQNLAEGANPNYTDPAKQLNEGAQEHAPKDPNQQASKSVLGYLNYL